MELVDFIQSNPNWREVLSSHPYNLKIKDDGTYVILSYSQIDSDFSLDMVRQARGIIFRLSDLKPVCVPFSKFFNVQERFASDIDWSTARVQEKIDGSIIKIYFSDNEWHISTNGTIDAFSAPLGLQMGGVETYGDLFMRGLRNHNLTWSYLTAVMNEGCTYMFEVVSPLNRVVVPYSETEIYHIGTRKNWGDYAEIEQDLGVQKPIEHNLFSAEDCLAAANELPFSEEGYVVVDGNWNRIKIKSAAYVAAHHLKNNGLITEEDILNLILLNEKSEFLSYYPEYKWLFDEIEIRFNRLVEVLDAEWNTFCERCLYLDVQNRKRAAELALKTFMPSCIFALYDKKYSSVQEFVRSMTTEKIIKAMEKL